jgi:hypothetical protein
MAIQLTPTSDQAIDYLTATISIPVRDMSRPMHTLLHRCARSVQRTYPGMAGYYDPEYSGPRIDLSKHLMWPSRGTQIIPQSQRLLALTAQNIPDPFIHMMGIVK